MILCRLVFSTLPKRTTGDQVSSHTLIKFSKTQTSLSSQSPSPFLSFFFFFFSPSPFPIIQGSLAWSCSLPPWNPHNWRVPWPHVTKGSLIPFRLISHLHFCKNKGGSDFSVMLNFGGKNNLATILSYFFGRKAFHLRTRGNVDIEFSNTKCLL